MTSVTVIFINVVFLIQPVFSKLFLRVKKIRNMDKTPKTLFPRWMPDKHYSLVLAVVCRQWSLPVICYVPSSVVQGGFTSHKIQICEVFETGCAVFYPLPRSLKIQRCLCDGARGGGGWGSRDFHWRGAYLCSPLEFNFTACLQIIIGTCHKQSYLTCNPSMPVLSVCKFYKCLQSDECIQGFWILPLELSLWQYNFLSYSKILSIGPARNQAWAYHSKRQAPELTELTNFSHYLSGMWHSYLVLALALKARICSAYRCSLIW